MSTVDLLEQSAQPSCLLETYPRRNQRVPHELLAQARRPSQWVENYPARRTRIPHELLEQAVSASPSTPGPPYRMRAYHTVAPVGYVYWEVSGTPDYSGTAPNVPYPAINLARIRVQG